MKSKKLAALGLTAVLSLGLLTACSGGSDDTNETPAGSMPPCDRKRRARRRQSRQLDLR